MKAAIGLFSQLGEVMKYQNGYLVNLLYSGNEFLDNYVDEQPALLKHYDGVVACLSGYDSDALEEECDRQGICYSYLNPTEAQELGISFSSVETPQSDVFWFEKVCV